jgi:hypothetical protein
MGDISGSSISTGSFGRLEAAGDVELKAGNLIIGTHGKGIDFSANTDDESGAGSVSAEILDDYEEGTFTPAMTSGTAGHAVGIYRKIGDLVYIAIMMTGVETDTANANNHYCTGLPFVHAAGFYSHIGESSMYLVDWPAGVMNFECRVSANESQLMLTWNRDESSTISADGSNWDHVDCQFFASGIYLAA